MIDELLAEAVADGTCEGVAATIVSADGVLYEGSAGSARLDTFFRNASMTKALTTTGLVRLVDEGRLSLDDTVESVVPEFGELQVLEGFDGDIPIMRAPASKATIRQLATHTAGCGYGFFSEKLARYEELTGLPSPLTGAKSSLGGPLVTDPGTVWEYGTSTDWAGLVIESVSGQTLGEYLRTALFDPLGMTETTFHPTDDQRARMIPVLLRNAEGGLDASPLDMPLEPEWDAGGHGSYGTVGDYGRFIRAMLCGGELDGNRVLSQSAVDSMFADHISGIPMPEVMRSVDPVLTNDVLSPPVPQGWGLGFHLMKIDLPGMRRAGTGDWAGIFNCYFWIDRAAGVGGALMTQVLPFFDARIIQKVLSFEKAAYARVPAYDA